MDLSACRSCFCHNSQPNEEPMVSQECQNIVVSYPGPSSANNNSSGDDAVAPSKNCYRLVVLGSSRVGKTCLVARFLGHKYTDGYTPTIEDFHRKIYRIRGEIYQLDILDTSGFHPFPAMRRLSFLTGDIFVIVFSMDSRESFEEAARLREQILETKVNALASTGGGVGLTRKKTLPRVPMVFAGNKCDRDMKTVTVEEAQAYCDSQDASCTFVEASAKKNFRVEEVFYQLFLVAHLPLEMAPNHHKRVSASFGSPSPLPPPTPVHQSKKYHLSVKRKLSDALGVVTPNARRPSIRTDLMIMRNKTSRRGDNSGASNNNSKWWKKSGDVCNLQ
ncbi:unnamed protein product [Diabrotica balteata]|uniref:GTP-binding protein Rhes n=1 Tax=Diabrotica balteata TaxID=107213 RepID=A0A9N9T4I2_DIABA|nr:unnamed protein product [Diabrotica balteata]